MSEHPPTGRLAVLARFAAAIAGRPVADWSPRPPIPDEAPSGHDIGGGLTLWRLPVGEVRIRERHRALEPDLADAPDDFRFPLTMADDRITPWLPCTAWLLEHPEGPMLIDTGESERFGEAGYFGDGASAALRRLYPRIGDFRNAAETSLAARLAAAGRGAGPRPQDIPLCVLTHLHSDHVGNVEALANARIVVAEAETHGGPGLLTGKLPRDGRVQAMAPPEDGAPLTQAGDVRLIPLPGHTAGHCGVLIDAGPRRVLIAGDAAFSDAQVSAETIQGIAADGRAARRSYARIRALAAERETIVLYAHDRDAKRRLTALDPTRF